jgi:hypothetical protein
VLRLLLLLLAAATLATAASAARRAPNAQLLVGITDDNPQWIKASWAPVVLEHDLGLGALRLTLAWHRGEAAPTSKELLPLRRALAVARGLRIVLAVYGAAKEAPLDVEDQSAFCTYVRATLLQLPQIADVVVWNEANTGASWPQAAAPAQYEALLARCYDVLHAARPGVNVIASTAPHAGRHATAPGDFWRRLGAAYRISGRNAPLLDTYGHNAYPQNSAEEPWARHTRGPIDEGDLDRLLKALRSAFAGTGQPLPGQGATRVWYMEDGFQSTVAGHRGYHGAETDAHAVDPAVEAERLGDAVRLAACQPEVGAFFNFELLDERRLEGWQSGLIFVDGAEKPAYAALKQAIAEVRAGRVDCSRFPT